MKKMLFVVSCLMAIFTNRLYSQDSITELRLECWRDTSLLTIDKIEEYVYTPKNHKMKNHCIVVYIVKAHYAEKKDYATSLILASTDTIGVHKSKKSFYNINRNIHNRAITEGNTYLFHLELWECLPIVGHVPAFFDVEGICIPIEICPLQPYKANELDGLEYTGDLLDNN